MVFSDHLYLLHHTCDDSTCSLSTNYKERDSSSAKFWSHSLLRAMKQDLMYGI